MFDSRVVKHELNQYWYSEHTISYILDEVTHHSTRCAFLSTPSLYFALVSRASDKVRGAEGDDTEAVATDTSATDTKLRELCEHSRLFEKDNQWCGDSHVVSYDFHYPDRIPVQYMGAFDYVVADPPFITDDVWRQYVATVKLLLVPGGKMLFTTVLENHCTLEELLDAPLFIARFRPCVAHLTYQYVCFCNYEPTKLNVMNSEVESRECDESALRVRSAIEMANELRRSEKTFAAQLHQRDRTGEVPLPSMTHAHDDLHHTTASPNTTGRSEAPVDWNSLPLHAMPWGHIPEHLRPYANEPHLAASEQQSMCSLQQSRLTGQSGDLGEGRGCDDGAVAATPQPEVDFGATYAMLLHLREQLNEFKNGIDSLQRLMDKKMRLRHQRVKLKKKMLTAIGGAKDESSVDAGALSATQVAVQVQSSADQQLIDQEDEARNGAAGQNDDTSYSAEGGHEEEQLCGSQQL